MGGLQLSRKPGDQIRIGADIVITFGEIKGGQARVTITAPPNMKISRVDGILPPTETDHFEPGAV